MKTREIPDGAIKVNLRDVQQRDNYSCGAGAAMSVFAFYGVGPEDLEELKTALQTNNEFGTYYKNIADYAKSLGLDVSTVQEMSKQDLQKLLNENTPVILSMQAYATDEKVYDDPNSNDDGHYVVAIGYDKDDYFYFMDPSLTGRHGFLSWSDLEKRWHENEGSDKLELSHHLALVIKPGKQRKFMARKVE